MSKDDELATLFEWAARLASSCFAAETSPKGAPVGCKDDQVSSLFVDQQFGLVVFPLEAGLSRFALL